MNTGRSLALGCVLILSACSSEESALAAFKKTTAATELDQCVGVNGSVDWSTFKPKDANADVVGIQADLKKKGKEFSVQWLYNTKTEVSEIAYMGSGKPTSRMLGAIEFGSFCL